MNNSNQSADATPDAAPISAPAVQRARVKRPQRCQVQWRDASLDQLIPSDHRVRQVWAYVDALNVIPLYQKIRAVEGGVGRDAVDPKILLALWMYATIEGVSKARHLARLCERDLPYMWICGDVGVNYHLLSDFRVEHGAFLEQLLTDTIATLLHQGIVTLEVVAQDGIRVRAHAGARSFRREKTLKQCRQEAAEQVRRLREERDDDDTNAGHARRQAAKERAADDRLQRVEAALANLAELQEQKESRKRGSGEEARASTTDPEARVMKMADGGYRPAYNIQFQSAGNVQMIISVDVSNNGSDGGQMAPLHAHACETYGVPTHYAVDGGFTTNEDVTTVEQRGSKVIGPMNHAQRIERRGGDPHARRAQDTDEMAAFRTRMKTPEAQAILRQRPSIAEFPNAVCRNHGLQQFRVRGLPKVMAVALWHAVTYNFLRMLNLNLLDKVLPQADTA